jgi:hypothetical protein
MNPVNPLVPNPFAVLGLPEWPDLDDETVHAAWQQIAAETHPDRDDGGNLARYTQATAAYYELSSPWGRSEAFADLLELAWAEGRYDAYPGYDPGGDLPLPPRPVGDRARPGPARRAAAPGRPDPGPPAPRPPLAPGHPRRRHGRPVPGHRHPVPRSARRQFQRRGPDRGVRGVSPERHRPARPAGPPDQPGHKELMPPAGPRAPGWTGPVPGCPAVLRLGRGGPSRPRRPGKSRADRSRPVKPSPLDWPGPARTPAGGRR